jgi:predicted ATP-dependent endonuclease of OLD family
MTVTQSETTKTNSPNDSGFYSGIIIEGFRQFKKLELTNLGKVNLILGPNNAGKTSILEAIYIHACYGDIRLIYDNLILPRISQTRNISGFLEVGEQIISLFNQNKNSDSNNYQFTITREILSNLDEKKDIFQVSKCGFQVSKELNKLHPHRLHRYAHQTKDGYNFSESINNNNNIYMGKWLIPRDINSRMWFREADIFLNLSKFTIKVIYTQGAIEFPQSKGIFHDILAHREPQATVAVFSHLKRYRLLEKFTQEMSMIFPIIKQIDTIPYPDGSFSPIYIINSNDELLPIYNFGDGMRRWFHLLGNLMIYPNSVHLIEEIDATFHPNAQEKFGHLLVEYAEKFNNQLFMTSHNLEFADKFLESLYGEEGTITEDQEDPVRVITIGQSRDDPEKTTVWNLTGRQAHRGRKLYNVELR